MNIITREAEPKLLEIVASLKNDPGSHYGLHFAFSRLLDHYKSDYQLKIALNILNDIFRDSGGDILSVAMAISSCSITAKTGC